MDKQGVSSTVSATVPLTPPESEAPEPMTVASRPCIIVLRTARSGTHAQS